MARFKETKGGKKEVCKAVKDFAKEYAEECVNYTKKQDAENFAIKMLKAGKYALDEIALLTDLPLDRVQSLQKNLNS